MDQIGKLVGEMDVQESGHAQVYVYQPSNADILDRMEALTDLFPQQNGRTSSSSSQQNPLLQRVQQNATQSTASSQSTFGSSGGSVSGSGGLARIQGESRDGSATFQGAVAMVAEVALAEQAASAPGLMGTLTWRLSR